MTDIDLNQLVAVLDPAGQGRRCPVDEMAEALHVQAPYTDAWALPQLLLDVLQRGEAEGRWSTARATVRRGRTTLPKSVVLPRRVPAGDKLKPVDVPLRSEIASWAATLPLSASQRELVTAVNEWLRRTNGGNVPIVAVAERAYELVGDEKAFDSSPPRGGATLWRPDRLTFELLRCERVATPLTWEPTTPAIGRAGPMVCVENHATFRTLLRILRERHTPRWVAVAWVQGRNTAPLESLADLPFQVNRLDYLGNLDPAGLEIAVSACKAAGTAGVSAGPADLLWELLAVSPPRPGPKAKLDQARRLAAWLPETVRERAVALLTDGKAIPQEALRYDILAPALASAPTEP